MERDFHVVTGAFGYSGKYIAARLLQAGRRVRTLTNSVQRANPFGQAVEARPFNFDRPDRLREDLRNAAVLYNTYWVRFNYGDFSHATAVANTLKLFGACQAAGVGRVQLELIIGKRRPILRVPPSLGYVLGRVVGKLTGDVLITREEIEGLMQNLLCTTSPPAGQTRLTDWARAHAENLGRHYASELARRRDRTAAY